MVGNDDRWGRGDRAEVDVAGDERAEIAGRDEVYCRSCGKPIHEAVEQCPHCGVRRLGAGAGTNLTERRQYELEKIATKSRILGVLLGFIPPLGYVYLGKWWWALLNVLTVHFLFLGFLLVPLHVLKIISDARSELRDAGVSGY